MPDVVAGTLLEPVALLWFPATVVILCVTISTFLILKLLVSAKYRLPEASVRIPNPEEIAPDIAAPPSPENPTEPVPATVVILQVPATTEAATATRGMPPSANRASSNLIFKIVVVIITKRANETKNWN